MNINTIEIKMLMKPRVGALIAICFGMLMSTMAHAKLATQCESGLEKYVIIIDTSGSVSTSEFAFFESAADNLVDTALDGTRNAEVAIVHYNTSGNGGSGTHGYDVVVPFTSSAATAKTWTRANTDSSSPLYNRIQDHLPGSLEAMRSDNVWLNTGSDIYVGDAQDLSIIIYTDASVARQGDTEDTSLVGISYPTGTTSTTDGTTNWGTISNPPEWGDLIGWRATVTNDNSGGGCCSSLLDLGKKWDNSNSVSPDSLPFYGEYDWLKNTLNADITVVAVNYSGTYPRHDIEKAAISAIASVGGDYAGEVAINPNDPDIVGAGPRKAYFAPNFASLPEVELIVSQRISVGNSISVATTNDQGEGSVVQGFSQPVMNSGNENVYWSGELRAFFIDKWGYFREDNPSSGVQGQLDGPTVDRAFELKFDDGDTTDPTDTGDQITKIQRLNLIFDASGEEVVGTTLDGTEVDATFLDPIWDISSTLNSYDQSTIDDQRGYTAKAGASAASRYIFTWVDGGAAADGIVDLNSEIYDFEWQSTGSISTKAITPSNRNALLGAASDVEAEGIVAFVRGKEGVAGTRTRTLDGVSYLLGDVENSNPLQVLPPRDNYDIEYGDTDYATFKERYEGRRRVVYVGANDGMLHAYNMGFWDTVSSKFSTSAPSNYSAPSGGVTSPTTHELGAELWAYLPSESLNRLKFLASDTFSLEVGATRPSQHFYFVDGTVQAFDAKIFADDGDNGTHPGGWGTILIAATGYGGGADDSSYIVMDITDPEQKPKLLFEIKHADLDMTTVRPALVRLNVTGSDKWFLAFGSGVDSQESHTSSTAAKLFSFELNYDTADSSRFSTPLSLAGRTSNSFVGDIVAVDWDTSDMYHDALYFGTVESTPITITNPDGSIDISYSNSGDLRRLDVSSLSESVMLNAGLPIMLRPLALTDFVDVQSTDPITGDTIVTPTPINYVNVGTGKTITSADLESTQQHYQVSVIEAMDSSGAIVGGSVSLTDLKDISGIQVSTAGTITGGGAVKNTEELASDIAVNHKGWKRPFDTTNALGSERTTSPTINFQGVIFYVTTRNGSQQCFQRLQSVVYSSDIRTGVPFYEPGFNGVFGDDDGDGFFDDSINFGSGIVREITLFGDRLLGPSDLGDIQNRQVNLPSGGGGTTTNPSNFGKGRKAWTEIPL